MQTQLASRLFSEPCSRPDLGRGRGKYEGLPAKPVLAWKNLIIHVGSPRMFWKVTHLGVRVLGLDLASGLKSEKIFFQQSSFLHGDNRERVWDGYSHLCQWESDCTYGPPVIVVWDYAGKETMRSSFHCSPLLISWVIPWLQCHSYHTDTPFKCVTSVK